MIRSNKGSPDSPCSRCGAVCTAVFASLLVACAIRAGAADVVEVRQGDAVYRIPEQRWKALLEALEERAAAPHPGPQVQPAPPAAGAPPAPASPPSALSRTSLALIAIVVCLVLGGAALAVRQWVLEPRRRRAPLLKALALIRENREADWAAAEALLRESLTAGLAPNDIANARFALAYVRARMGRYLDAQAILADLAASGDDSRETLYLQMWTASQRGAHDDAEQIFNEHSASLEGFLQSRLIAAIACLNRAQRHWEKKDTSQAVQLFRRLRELNELTDQIPTHVEGHRLLLGVQELSQKNYRAASEHFQSAAEAAADDWTRFKGQVGGLLCDWLAKEDSRGELDARLEELVAGFLDARGAESPELAQASCAQCSRQQVVRASDRGRQVVCRDCARSFEVGELTPLPTPADAEAPPPAPLMNDDDLLLRDALVWNMMSLLYAWASQPERTPLPSEELARMEERGARVRGIDSQSAHARLIEGLVRYYFGFHDDQLRKQGVDLIQQATEHGASLTQVNNLLEGEKEREKRRAQSRPRMQQKTRQYFSDTGVPDDVRTDVYDQVRTYVKPDNRDFRDVEIPPFDAANAPTVADLGLRVESMESEVVEFLRDNPQIAGEVQEEINTSKKGLAEISQQLQLETRKFQEREGVIRRILAQQAFQEEVP